MNNKEHLTYEGLIKIVSIRASLNKGLSQTIADEFPNIIPAVRSPVYESKILDPQWLAGFASAEGCFTLTVNNSTSHKLGKTIQTTFTITQHIRDKLLMEYLIDYLDCGMLYKRNEACDFRVRSIVDIKKKIIPFFDKYPIQGVKSLAYVDFCRAAYLIDKKSHLTTDGIDELLEIKREINKIR
uniref:LAGLIDADG endonuclease n=1 Tax=Chrysoporthe austroafricana TaxID=354353 RepID=A0A191MWM1_9PEZI|nr:LAGLIDADG endonuclease [Chrysoporthe austroafricana]AMX22065.1 LAGLIDADG endonuclease [Chrysoporthe austroafricana]